MRKQLLALTVGGSMALSLIAGQGLASTHSTPESESTAAINTASNLKAPTSPSNFRWNNIQIITTARIQDCGSPMSVSRYNERGRLIGQKVIANSNNWSLFPRDIYTRYRSNSFHLLFAAYNCKTEESRLYSWDLNSKKRPKLVMSKKRPDLIMDAKYDLATGNVLFLNWFRLASNWTVETVGKNGRNNRVLWDKGRARTKITPTVIVPDTGRKLRVGGRLANSSTEIWHVVQLDSVRPFQEQLAATGRGGFGDFAAGDFGGLFEDGTIYVTRKWGSYLCKGSTSIDVQADANCSKYESPLKTDPGFVRAQWSFGQIDGAPSKSGTVYWFGFSEVAVQSAYLASDDRPALSRPMRLRGGGADNMVEGIAATNTDFAVDRLPFRTFILK